MCHAAMRLQRDTRSCRLADACRARAGTGSAVAPRMPGTPTACPKGGLALAPAQRGRGGAAATVMLARKQEELRTTLLHKLRARYAVVPAAVVDREVALFMKQGAFTAAELRKLEARVQFLARGDGPSAQPSPSHTSRASMLAHTDGSWAAIAQLQLALDEEQKQREAQEQRVRQQRLKADLERQLQQQQREQAQALQQRAFDRAEADRLAAIWAAEEREAKERSRHAKLQRGREALEGMKVRAERRQRVVHAQRDAERAVVRELEQQCELERRQLEAAKEAEKARVGELLLDDKRRRREREARQLEERGEAVRLMYVQEQRELAAERRREEQQLALRKCTQQRVAALERAVAASPPRSRPAAALGAGPPVAGWGLATQFARPDASRLDAQPMQEQLRQEYDAQLRVLRQRKLEEQERDRECQRQAAEAAQEHERQQKRQREMEATRRLAYRDELARQVRSVAQRCLHAGADKARLYSLQIRERSASVSGPAMSPVEMQVRAPPPHVAAHLLALRHSHLYSTAEPLSLGAATAMMRVCSTPDVPHSRCRRPSLMQKRLCRNLRMQACSTAVCIHR